MSSLGNTTQQTAQSQSTPTSSDASQNVTTETAGIPNECNTANNIHQIKNIQYITALPTYISEETTYTTILTSPATTFGETPLITTVSKESVSEARIVCGK